MNIWILYLIRGAREWLEPVIEEQRLRHPFREIFMSKLRVFFPLAEIPLYFPKEIRFYLPAFPRENTKAAAVVNELCAAGISRSTIWTPAGPSPYMSVKRYLRLFYRLPGALLFLFYLVRRTSVLDWIDLRILLGREVFRQLLSRHPMVEPIIISDVGPDQRMLWSASSVVGGKALWWQDDHKLIAPLYYVVASAAVLNQDGYETVLRSSPSALIVHRPSVLLKPMRPIPYHPRVGIATNAFFIASKEQRQLLDHIRQLFKVSNLYVRLHPNTELVLTDFPEPWLSIAPFDEPLEEFASKVDIVIVGNSAVQLSLVCEGVPVCHVSGLDPQGFDDYGYLQRRFTYGAKILDTNTISDMTNFFNDPELQVRIADYVRVRDDVNLEGLSRLNSY